MPSPETVERIAERAVEADNGGERNCSSPLFLSEWDEERIVIECEAIVGDESTIELDPLEIPWSMEDCNEGCSIEIKGSSEVDGRMEFTALSFSMRIELTAFIFSLVFNREEVSVVVFVLALELPSIALLTVNRRVFEVIVFKKSIE